jgi:uridine nucleosidase
MTASTEAVAPIKLVIDTDPGIDDSMAILGAFSCERVDVLALTSIFGNVPTELATRNALFLRSKAGRPDVPVYRGCATSLCGAAKERIADFVHGDDGFGNTDQVFTETADDAAAGSAAEHIVRLANEHPGEVVILCLAALTNLALALQLDSKLQEKLKGVVVLGGAFEVNGNVNPSAEANIFGDPEAANVVFSRISRPKLQLIGLDVTHKCVLTAAELDELKYSTSSSHGPFLHDISQFYLKYHKESYGMDGIFLHDAAAFAAVVRPDLFEWKAGKVVVVEDGPARGMTVMDRMEREWIGENAWSHRAVVDVALGVQSTQLVQFVKKLL